MISLIAVATSAVDPVQKTRKTSGMTQRAKETTNDESSSFAE